MRFVIYSVIPFLIASLISYHTFTSHHATEGEGEARCQEGEEQEEGRERREEEAVPAPAKKRGAKKEAATATPPPTPPPTASEEGVEEEEDEEERDEVSLVRETPDPYYQDVYVAPDMSSSQADVETKASQVAKQDRVLDITDKQQDDLANFVHNTPLLYDRSKLGWMSLRRDWRQWHQRALEQSDS